MWSRLILVVTGFLLASVAPISSAQNPEVDGSFVEIGDDNDNDDADTGRIDLFDDDDANGPNGNDGRGALIEAFYDLSDEDGTLLDIGDVEELIRINGEYPFGDGIFQGGLFDGGLLDIDLTGDELIGNDLLGDGLLGGL